MDKEREEYALLRRAVSFLYVMLRTEEEPKHYKPCLKSFDQAMEDSAVGKQKRFPEEEPQSCPLSARWKAQAPRNAPSVNLMPWVHYLAYQHI